MSLSSFTYCMLAAGWVVLAAVRLWCGSFSGSDGFLSSFCPSFFIFQPMKALWASAGTSQPVLSSQEVQTVFYQVPEIRDMHQSFSSGLKARLSGWDRTGSGSEEGEEKNHSGFDLIVGDLFLKMVSAGELSFSLA